MHLETRILPFALDDPCGHEVAGSAVPSTDDQQGLIGRKFPAPGGRASRGLGVGREKEEYGWRRRQRGRLPAHAREKEEEQGRRRRQQRRLSAPRPDFRGEEDGARRLCRRRQSLSALPLSGPSGRASIGLGVGREEEEHGWRWRQRGMLPLQKEGGGVGAVAVTTKVVGPAPGIDEGCRPRARTGAEEEEHGCRRQRGRGPVPRPR